MNWIAQQQRFLMTASLIGVALVTGCSSGSKHGGTPAALHSDASKYVGHYSGPRGQPVRVKKSGTGFDLDMTSDGKSKTYDAYVLNLDGVDVWEIALAEPDAAQDSQGRPQTRTYLYGRTERSERTVTFRRLRTEWLEQQASAMPDAAFGRTPQVAEGSGAIVVKHPAAMEQLLRKAIHDPAAFGEAEIFTVVK